MQDQKYTHKYDTSELLKTGTTMEGSKNYEVTQTILKSLMPYVMYA